MDNAKKNLVLHFGVGRHASFKVRKNIKFWLDGYLSETPLLILLNQRHFMIHHKKSHGGFPPGFEDEKVYPCEVCSEEFLTDKNLAMHKLNTHPSGKVEEKFVCDRCDTGHDYRSARMLLKHYFQVGMSGYHFF